MSTLGDPQLYLIIPVFNRLQSLQLLKQSLEVQSDLDFSVLVVDDGSEPPITLTGDRLSVLRVNKGGPASARNRGVKALPTCASERLLVFIDSDCALPVDYVRDVKKLFSDLNIQFGGGPDRAPLQSSNFQKAVDFSMTSFLTTGGLRGGPYRIARFFPRGGNFVIRERLFLELGGFDESLRFGEDIEFGYRAVAKGVNPEFFQELFVFHQRRERLDLFLRQISAAGASKIAIARKTNGKHSWLHLMLLLLMVALAALLVLQPLICLLILIFYGVLVGILAGARYGSWWVALMAPAVACLQHLFFGLGIMTGLFGRAQVAKGSGERQW